MSSNALRATARPSAWEGFRRVADEITDIKLLDVALTFEVDQVTDDLDIQVLSDCLQVVLTGRGSPKTGPQIIRPQKSA